MKHYPPILETPTKVPENKYANRKPPHYYYKVSGLEPYSGPWNRETAKHLLSRTCFGYKESDLDSIVQAGMDNAVTSLLSSHNTYTLPINDYHEQLNDPDCPAEETWVDKGFTTDPMINNRRSRSFQSWWFGEMLEQPLSIQEKMTLFWHNHFATEILTVNYANFIYEHNQLLRSNILGNFKSLTKAVTLDRAMMIYLNGFRNQKNRPDENYSRELQELFTVGKGPNSNYTEEDVREAARVLTGWTFDQEANLVFNPNLHDQGDKRFSAYYENTVIKGKSDGEAELDELLDMIFARDEAAETLVTKLYRYFVYYVIDDEINTKVIQPLAELFRQSNYEIQPVLEALFKSAHFYDAYTKGAIIKNPMDFLVGHHKHTGLESRRSTPTERFKGLYAMNVLSSVLQMMLGSPPNVAGWKAYYQAPQYHEHWINSVTLPKRNQIADVIMLAPNGFRILGVNIFLDVLELTEGIPNANDPNLLVQYWVDLIFAKGLSDEQKTTLKNILLYGQTEDYYWTVAWEDYLADKQNTQKRNLVYALLYGFYKQLFNLPEYQLS